MTESTVLTITPLDNSALHRIALVIEAQPAQVVFDIVGDPLQLRQWLSDNAEAIRTLPTPAWMDLSRGFASARRDFYDWLALDPENGLDPRTEEMEVFSMVHGLAFALEGTDVPNAFIVKKGDHYELSCHDNDEQWCFDIEPPSFLNATHDLARF